MKLFKLIVHQKNFSPEELIINQKDYPELKIGDIVEIYHSEDDYSRLLLQITSFKDDFRETISVDQTIALAFQLRTYSDVCVNIVSAETVALDSLELTFKDSYLGRSEMWRLKNTLVNTCVYLNKKIEFCGGSIRCQVYEMWSQGDRVACGVITEETKIVFRSHTSMVYLFLQMSSEMWDSDVHGDLYFEKAVNGFLSDLFQKWKKHGSFHEVTIVLFSRTFYDAKSLDEFPLYMRECLQQDYKGRFYEDFYRLVVQNERYEDWTNTIVQLRRLFSDYQTQVVEYHKREGFKIPKAANSTAAQGNFLEVLNMSLNVFENHYLDRSFDRTGQLSVVITPGVGVFEVERELTNVTKQRIIDGGVGSDLVCVGEQPLHAVPLLKFHNKDSVNAVDNYSMPHWINLSFYSTNKKLAHCNFTPRIKLPPKHEKLPPESPKLVQQDDEIMPNSVFDYDAYDAGVFQIPTHHSSSRVTEKGEKIISKHIDKKGSVTLDGPDPHRLKRKLSDPDVHHLASPNNFLANSDTASSSRSASLSLPMSSPTQSPEDILMELSLNSEVQKSNEFMDAVIAPKVLPHSLRSGRALINPFDPSHVTIKLTSNRRRWTHIFPKGPTGVLIQQHHYQAVPAQNSESQLNSADKDKKSKGIQPPTKDNKTLLWGATGEQEWTPALTTGVDWKSLTIPACLPITTDYFPDERSLQNDYLVSDYSLLPDDVNADFAQQRAIYKKPLSTREVFKELVSQRLAQGFQLIVLPSVSPFGGTPTNSHTSSLVQSKNSESNEQYLLSIGRIFHNISLSGSEISVTRYRPRHPYPPFTVRYQYRFQAPDHPTYEWSSVCFTTEKLENYNWNYLDHYICTRGDTDFPLVESLKYWRFRVYLLPLTWNSGVTKKIMDGSAHCDLYSASTVTEQIYLVESYLKYVETVINKIKRPTSHKKPWSPILGATAQSRRRHSTALIALSHTTNYQNSAMGGSPFRDRLGSFRLPDKPRPRSGSKVFERGRTSPAVESMSDSVFENENSEEVPEPRLKSNSSLQEILDAMKHPATGVGFLASHVSLPSNTFMSADAVSWLVNHVEGVTDGDKAASIMESLMQSSLVCHASGDSRHPFIIGFYLYHFVAQDSTDEYGKPLGDLHSFQNEWVEVEVKHPTNWRKVSEDVLSQGVSNAPVFFAQQLVDKCQDNERPSRKWPNPLYKQVHLEIDINNKSDRVEWGHCRYQSLFTPSRAYELVVEWVAATGTLVADLVSGWARKAQSCGMQMIPLPGDPLARPFKSKSDPLRGPVFIALNIEALVDENEDLFKEFPEESRGTRLVLFQEAIIQRFGFIPTVVESRSYASERKHNHHHQYVHLTGNIFILIPSKPCSREEDRSFPMRLQKDHRGRYPIPSDVVNSPREEFITRHVNGSHQNNEDYEHKPGFLWFWNHMVSKRWKTSASPATGDEAFQNKILKDFREFCSNTDNRLLDFWNQSKITEK